VVDGYRGSEENQDHGQEEKMRPCFHKPQSGVHKMETEADLHKFLTVFHLFSSRLAWMNMFICSKAKTLNTLLFHST
jgi:hypothetical protein